MSNVARSSWIAACAAVVAAGAIAATPVVAPLPALPTLQSDGVQLTTSFDPLAAWEDVFSTAKTNGTAIWDNVSATPAVALQQLIADLHSGASIDPKAVLGAIAQPSTDVSLSPSPLTLSNDGLQTLITLVLPNYLPKDFPLTADQLTPILSFLASPLSGVLIGSLAPSISPWVALYNSVNDIQGALSGNTPDTTTALQDLVNIPANMVGGYLNGATLDLTGLLPELTKAGLLPADMDVTALSYTFGGLLSPGLTANDVEGFVKDVTDGSSPGIGGSVINGLGLTTGLMGFPLVVEGHGVGALGALASLDQIIAGALGWDGSGNPLADLAGSGDTGASEALADLIGSLNV